ncbi:MAG: GDSL-type esterase/lipase family protein [Veillonellaceae bacterium]|nr:MAG: GDSL-type esterase/lipase family protein [Veillonellaceae bacterium]
MNCFGDSLTEGFGLRKGRYWLEIATREIHGIRFRNFGSCGSLSSDILQKAEFFLERAGSQDEIFIMGGTNDLLCRIRLSSLEKNMEGGISHIAASLPLTIAIPPQVTRASVEAGWQSEFSYDANQEDYRTYISFLKELAQSLDVRVIDFSKVIPFDDDYYVDGVYPNEKGQELMAEAAIKVWGN